MVTGRRRRRKRETWRGAGVVNPVLVWPVPPFGDWIGGWIDDDETLWRRWMWVVLGRWDSSDSIV